MIRSYTGQVQRLFVPFWKREGEREPLLSVVRQLENALSNLV